jgi:hypothetical protein
MLPIAGKEEWVCDQDQHFWATLELPEHDKSKFYYHEGKQNVE